MKRISGIVLVVVLALGVLAVVAPRDFKLQREVIVNRPVDVVFAHIKFLQNHEKWNAWKKLDPGLQHEYVGTDGTVGFKATWESDNQEVGTAEQEITEILENQKIGTVIRFKKPFEADIDSYLLTETEADGRTKVTMGMEDQMPFPKYIISFVVNVVFDQQQKLVDHTDESLKGLKWLLESVPSPKGE
jgi:uncharacterized protein YjaZ